MLRLAAFSTVSRWFDRSFAREQQTWVVRCSICGFRDLFRFGHASRLELGIDVADMQRLFDESDYVLVGIGAVRASLLLRQQFELFEKVSYTLALLRACIDIRRSDARTRERAHGHESLFDERGSRTRSMRT